ncbi:MAG: helix-turn-helix domain-containing protein [Solirubrobacterales bacterium]
MRLDATTAKALSHPLRVEVLELLEREEASPAGLTRQLSGVALGLVAYHVEVLQRCDLIELVGTRPRRGAVEHFYRAKPSGPIELEGVPKALRGSVTATTLQSFVDATVAALEKGTIDRHEDSVLSSMSIRVDAIGRRQVVELGQATIDQLRRINDESHERAAAGGEPLVRLIVGIAGFEAAREDEKTS